MKAFRNIVFILIATFLVSCESLVDDINDNPNDLTVDILEARLFLTGALLSNTLVQAGHPMRIAGLYSGQFVAYQSLYLNIYNYNLTSEEAIGTWNRAYQGVVPQVRLIRDKLPENDLYQGICKIIEAHALGTIASLFGDIPYSQIFTEETDPAFDGQKSVFTALQSLLDSGIDDLGKATKATIPEDIYYRGDKDKWLEAAWTLKARYYMHTKEYGNAYAAAQKGISKAANTMKFTPGTSSFTEGDKNLFFEPLAGSRTGDIGTRNSYLMSLLDPANAGSRNNAKTDETARRAYYSIDEASAVANKGIAAAQEPMTLVSYQENLLILAEAGARTVDFNTGLGHLNALRAFLNTGGFLNAAFAGQPYKYEAYEAADFANGGMENPTGIDPLRALLREIVQERYVSGFFTYVAFDDARRLRKSDGDIAIPIPLNTPTATKHPERFIYSDDELNANANAPQDPGLYAVTEVNR